ncbi:DinB family protein [candidate division KSB1 bacterium]|nr:DinB family protein [candidate division KSB1 bacterium]
METQVAKKLIPLIHDTFESLKNYDESAVSRNPAPGKWSVKEIIGHLIDSAVNNHHRFIRAQREDVFVFPNYEQAFWVDLSPHLSWPSRYGVMIVIYSKQASDGRK